MNGKEDGRGIGHRGAFLILRDHELEQLAREAKAVEAKNLCPVRQKMAMVLALCRRE
jgi:hypothetical protein